MVYLGRVMNEQDDDTQAMKRQLGIAVVAWRCVSKILNTQKTSPRIRAIFYMVVVLAFLLLWRKH